MCVGHKLARHIFVGDMSWFANDLGNRLEKTTVPDEFYIEVFLDELLDCRS